MIKSYPSYTLYTKPIRHYNSDRNCMHTKPILIEMLEGRVLIYTYVYMYVYFVYA